MKESFVWRSAAVRVLQLWAAADACSDKIRSVFNDTNDLSSQNLEEPNESVV